MFREEVGLSTSEFSKKICISKNTLDNYEFKNQRPPNRNLIKISNFYQVSIDHLILGETSKYIKHPHFFQLAEKIDKLKYEDWQKISGFIDPLVHLNKNINHHYDTATKYTFSQNFNFNLRNIIEQNKLTAKVFGNKFNLTERQIVGYKMQSECSLESLGQFSDEFEISIHWLLTGQKLFYNFRNREFEEQILRADEYLDKKHIDMAVELIEKIIAIRDS